MGFYWIMVLGFTKETVMSMIHICSPTAASSVTGIPQNCIQPNAVDLPIKAIFAIDTTSMFEIGLNHKKHRVNTLVEPIDGYWNLDAGVYEVVYDFEQMEIADDEAGFVIVRSTFNRNGCKLSSGLFDSGFKSNTAAGVLTVCGPTRIEVGVPVGQFILFKSEMLHRYNGSYGLDANGQPKVDEQRYITE